MQFFETTKMKTLEKFCFVFWTSKQEKIEI